MNSSLNIVLWGFMGTGKSTVGRLLASQLSRPFVDMDQVLVERLGASISEIFATQGEATFREAERLLCQELAGRVGLVIAAGGGALLAANNREAIEQSGVIVLLKAAIDALIPRLALSSGSRPLLADDPVRRASELIAQRTQAYDTIALQVDTSGLEPQQVAERVLELVEGHLELPSMIRIPIRAAGAHYDVCIRDGILDELGHLLTRRAIDGKLAVVSHERIMAHHGARLLRGLAGFDVVPCLIEEGEEAKTLRTVEGLYGQFLDAGLDRGSVVLAFGGGIVGDVAGFAAATFMRGIDVVQVPTTVLAMVDASVGGKTAVNLERGKNLAGAFKQPRLVAVDPRVLATLPEAEVRSGMAETIKHALIGAPELFERLERGGNATGAAALADSIRVKASVVQEDPHEHGRRAVLNLGHTFGHAIEKCSGYRVRHGEAVGIGMLAAAQLGVSLGRCDGSLLARLRKLLLAQGLPAQANGLKAEELFTAMAYDKKRSRGRLRFVVPEAVGRVAIVDEPPEEVVMEALKSVVLTFAV